MPPKRLNRKTKNYGEEENRTNLQRFTADSTNLLLTLNSLGLSYNNVYANIPDLLNPYNQLTLLMNQNMNVSQVQQFYNQIFNQSLSFNNNQPNNNIFNQWNQHRLSNHNVQGESYNCNDNLYFSNSYQSNQVSLLSPNLFRPQRTSSRRIVPSWAFNNRTFYDLREYNAFSKAYDQAKLALRLMPKYEELNYLNSPFPDITSPYAPLNCFNYAVPRKIELLKQRTTMNSEEYEQMRQDFNANGIHVDWTPSEIAERKDSTLLSVNILKDSYFPPLEPPSESKIHEIWKVDSKVQPMLPANTNPSFNSSGDGQVSTCARIKLYKPNKKSLEDVS